MAQQMVIPPQRVAQPRPEPAWERPPDPPRWRPRTQSLVLALVAAGILVLLAVGTGALVQQQAVPTPEVFPRAVSGPAAAVVPAVEMRAPHDCGAACEFSSSGSADLHAFDHDQTGVSHVLFVEARWTRPSLRQLRGRAEAWRQTVTVRLPGSWVDGPVLLDNWSSDLPAARVGVVAADAATVTLTVTSRKPEHLDAGQLYRTQVFVWSSHDLDGAVWHYREDIDHAGSGGRRRPFHADESSTPRRGIGGWCARCYVAWDLAAAETS